MNFPICCRLTRNFLPGAVAGLLGFVVWMGDYPGGWLLAADGAGATIKSGPEVGSTVHAFFVRAVTGPHQSRSVCYVCRYGARPVVMVLLQGVDPNTPKLLKSIDRIVDAGRVAGARSFGVLVTDESARVVPILQTMAFDEKIELPLTAATSAVASSTCHNLHLDATTTVVLYRDQKVVATYGYRRGDLTADSIDELSDKMRQFVKSE